MRERVIKRVNTALSRGAREVFVTGHSLGGAMATLAALDLHFEIRRPVFLLTTGAPRAGNAAFASLVERRLRDPVRVVHHLDPIPRVPSGPDFRHAGRLLVLFETGRRVPTAKVSGRVQAKGLKHHDRALYAEILEKHLGFVRDGSAPTQNPQGRDFLRLAAEAEQASRLLGEQAEAVTDAQAAARERAEQAKQAAAERAQQARQAAAQRAQEAATNARGAAERARDAVRRRRRR